MEIKCNYRKYSNQRRKEEIKREQRTNEINRKQDCRFIHNCASNHIKCKRSKLIKSQEILLGFLKVKLRPTYMLSARNHFKYKDKGLRKDIPS